MTVIVVMAIFGLVTGFSTVRAGHSLPISIVRDFRLKGLAAGSVMLLIGVIGLALVWPLMKEGVRQWALSYVPAYAAGMLVASYARVDKNGASVMGLPGPAWRQIGLAPKLFVAVLLLTGPLYLLVTAFAPTGGPLVTLTCMVVFLVLTIWLQRLAVPCMWSKVFWPGSLLGLLERIDHLITKEEMMARILPTKAERTKVH